MALKRIEGIGNYLDDQDPGEIGTRKVKRRSVTDEEGEILATWAAGRVILEIGTGLAVSTRALARDAVHVVTVDLDPWVLDPHIPHVTFLRSRPECGSALHLPFTGAFIDGSHEASAVMEDLLWCRSLGIEDYMIHDTYLASVAGALHTLGWTLVEAYSTGCALGRYAAPVSR